ncbi:MAG: DUF3043 domain-containing protein [Pseudonocardiales bacterium]
MRLPHIKLPGRAGPAAEPAPAPEHEPKPAGKGRPTPKRRRAAPPPPPPATRKEAYARMRDRSKDQRVETRKGILEGDDRYVLPRDRGPARRLVRDIVDSRRNVGSYFFGVAIAILLASSAPGLDANVKLAVSYLWLVMIFVLAGDSFLLARVIRRALAERLPDDDGPMRRHVFYGITRAVTFRRMRSPRPTVKIGTPV